MQLKDFVKEIGISEFKSVIGKWGSKVFFLILILFISLVAMGIANGSLDYLKDKMNDPFMQFVDVPHQFLGTVEGFPKFDKEVADKYAEDNSDIVESVFETYENGAWFFKNNNKDGKQKTGFILTTENKFYEALTTNADMMLSERNTFRNGGWGIIITENFMNTLELDLSTPYVNITPTSGYSFSVPICGVVQQLRDNKDFIMSETLYKFLYGRSEEIPNLKRNSAQGVARWFVPKVDQLSNDLKKIGVKVTEKFSDQPIPHVKGLMVELEDFDLDLSKYGAIRIYDYDVQGLNLQHITSDPDTYTFLFKDPDDVLVFDTWLKDNYGIHLEKSKVLAKRNFSFFEKLSHLLSFALIAFSIISIIFFIINLLLSHINKNKRNLGTLKAFGLPNKHIIILYSAITLMLVTISYVSAYIMSYFLGPVLLKFYISVSNINSENYLYEVIFSNRGFFSTFTLFVLIPTVIIIVRLFTYLYRVTPGDLIYERK